MKSASKFILLLISVFFSITHATANLTIDPVQFNAEIAALEQHINTPLIQQFYQENNHQLAWEDQRLAQSSHDFIRSVKADGFAPNDYHLDSLLALSVAADTQSKIQYDILLTDGLLKLAHDLRQGKFIPADIDPEWDIKQAKFDAISFLHNALNQDSLSSQLTQLAPQHPSYIYLKTALAHYEILADKGGWPLIPESPTLRLGDTHPAIATLRQRIAIEKGEFPAAIATYLAAEYDEALVEEVKYLQRRLGLKADGVIGPETHANFNITVAERVQQIKSNLERWRWLPQQLGDRHLFANLPTFTLQAIDNKEAVLDMRVIVGRKDRQTPSLSGDINHLVINPYWNVPHTLAYKDVLPHQQADPDYLTRKGIRVYEKIDGQSYEIDPNFIDWAAYSEYDLPFRFRQDPGAANSLGKIKFMFPNKHSIYLHDTPGKRLFKRTQRYFSSGCVRVEKPLALAEFILGKPAESVAKRIASRKNQTRYLKQTVPVYLVYLTAWADKDGAHFAPDIYQRDKLMAQIIQ